MLLEQKTVDVDEFMELFIDCTTKLHLASWGRLDPLDIGADADGDEATHIHTANCWRETPTAPCLKRGGVGAVHGWQLVLSKPNWSNWRHVACSTSIQI